MLLRNVFLKTLRDNRAGTIGWSLAMMLLMLAGAVQYPEVIRGVGAERARSIAEMTKAFEAFSFLLGDIAGLDTLGGYVTTRGLSIVPVILGMWALVLGVGLIRGEEQQGAMDLLLSTPHSRLSIFVQKLAALWLMLAIVSALAGVGLWLGAISIRESLPAGALAATSLNIFGVVAFWGAAGLLAGQLISTRRKASSVVAGILFGTYLVGNLVGSISSLEWLAYLMPNHYYALSKPLAPGRTFEPGAWLVLALLAVAAAGLAAFLFLRRDIGAAYSLRGRTPRTASAPARARTGWLGSPLSRNLGDIVGPVLAWGLGLGAFAWMFVATSSEVLGPLRQLAQGQGWVAALLGNVSSDEAYLSVGFFMQLPALLSVFAITQIESWTSDEEEGRMEMLMSMPLPRWRELAARYIAAMLGMAAILAILGVVILGAAAASGLKLDAGRLIGSLAALLPVVMVIVAFGLCLATWFRRPSYALYITIALVAVMYFFEILARIFRLPDAALNISVFHLYGRPLTEGIKWGGLLALVAATIIFVAGSLVGLQRRDIAK